MCYDAGMANLIDTLYDRTKRQSDNASPLLTFLLLPALIPHELVHYLTGRLLGMEIRLYLREVIYKRTDLWKEITMALAPTVFSLSIIVFAFFLDPDNEWTLVLLMYGGVSLSLCSLDILKAIKKIGGL